MTDFKPTARVVLDSISPEYKRITTVEVTIHRFVLPEFNTHRVLSRNSASSRAIPARKLTEKILVEDVLPLEWRAEKPGMQGGDELSEDVQVKAREVWLDARSDALGAVSKLRELGVHKSITNRLMEPFAPHTIIATATDWDGFFAQRISPLAQPEIREAAIAMKDAMRTSKAQRLQYGEWHTPYVQEDEKDEHISILRRISAARCARVSYLTHDGHRSIAKDLELWTRLVGAKPRHYSPLEHVATPASDPTLGNLTGWAQLRHLEQYW